MKSVADTLFRDWPGFSGVLRYIIIPRNNAENRKLNCIKKDNTRMR